MRLVKRILLALSTGYVAFFLNERVFWSFPRPDDTLPGLVMGWLLYSFFAYICLIAIQQYRVRTIWALFLVGSLLGWLVEGVFALTTLGGTEMPFPISIPWTALAWHALAFILIWYGMLRVLATSTLKTLFATIGLGIFWGTWSLFWPTNTGDVATTTPDIFLLNGLLCTALYILALQSYHFLTVQEFAATKTEKIVLGVLLLSLYGMWTVPGGGIFMPLTLLPALFGIVYLGIRKNKKDETEPNALTLISTNIPLWRSAILLLAPCIAALIFNTGVFVPTNFMYLFTLTTLGSLMFVVSLYKVMRR